MQEQLKRRVAELESRLKYLQAHPEAFSELPPMPEFNMIVPMVEKQPFHPVCLEQSLVLVRDTVTLNGSDVACEGLFIYNLPSRKAVCG